MAITDKVGIFNLALNAIGERSNISSPTESSRRAEVCNLWYAPVLEQILAAAPWPEVTKIKYLALLSETDTDGVWAETEPREGYEYVYELPSDCIQPRYITGFQPFLITNYGDNLRALHCNIITAALAYSANVSNVATFSPQLRMAIVYGLAAHIVMPLTGKPARAAKMAEKANELMWQARETAANASNEQHEHVPDVIAARGYNFPVTTRYIHPVGSLLTTTSV